jgi:S1-C subfamily serine protease
VIRRPIVTTSVLIVAVAAVLVSLAEARPYSWLGVRIRDLSEVEMDEIASRHGIREGFGVFIADVMDDTPAARAGVQRGDIVVAFDDRPVVDGRTLQRLIAAAPRDADVKVTVLRPEGRRRLAVRLAEMPRPVLGDRVAAEFGFVIRESEAQGETGGRRLTDSVPSISAVLRDSAAEKAGLEVGDVILTIEDRSVLTRDVAREALADVASERPVHLTVRRGEQRVSLTIVPAPADRFPAPGGRE